MCKELVVSQIIGGLGNQMFQYATGRAISLNSDVPLVLDVSGYANYRLHNGFELFKVFNFAPSIATKKDIYSVLGWRSGKIFRKIMMRPSGIIFRDPKMIVEPYSHYWPEITNVSRCCYLAGYWQSEKYFKNVETTIRADFTFKNTPSQLNAELAEQIRQVDAVSLHVRRGDYAKDLKANATHGLCSLDYYQSAVRWISDQIKQPHFFVFSDDIDWVTNNLRIDFPCHYVDHNQGVESYNDMNLMSMCRHNIIANSSFSWWGAWLNKSPEKIVIAPKKWFADGREVKDLFPHGWVTIE